MTNISDDKQPSGSSLIRDEKDRSVGDQQQMKMSDQVRDWGQDLKSNAAEVGETFGEAAGEQIAKGKETAAELGASATRKLKDAGADYILGVAQAVDRAAGELDRDIPQAAQFIRKASHQAEDVASAIREREPRELLHDVEDFARQQPAIFFGGAMLLGFAALRLLKSSPPDGRRHPEGG